MQSQGVTLCQKLSAFVLSYLHLGKLGEISRWDLVLLLNLSVDLPQVGYELLFLGLFSKHTRHLLFQTADDVGVNLGVVNENSC